MDSTYTIVLSDGDMLSRVCGTNDNNLKLASDYGFGIRILNQDPWEMLISYIISAANNIPKCLSLVPATNI